MGRITIKLEDLADGRAASDDEARSWCVALEAGDILFFPKTPIEIAADDLAFLLGQQQTESSLHKNIAYKPNLDRLSGVDTKSTDAASVERLHGILRGYSQAVVAFLTGFLSPYHGNWRLDYASFRPQEERGRRLPTRRRNDLLHTDAFPTRPTGGARILRFFNNIHPRNAREWAVGEPFAEVAKEFVPAEIAPRPDPGAGKTILRSLGLGALMPSLRRSPYDDFMMRFHNFLKENNRYQYGRLRHPYDFPPGSSWMAYTDTLPHAVIAGQYALEQTLLVSPEVMIAPEHSPLKILEGIAGQALV